MTEVIVKKEPRLDYLTILVDHLDTNVKEEELDMGSWKCGTTACAVGHATNIPLFKELGLGLVLLKDTLYLETSICFNEHFNLKAVENLFNLDEADTSFLFYPQAYALESRIKPLTKQTVVDRIRNFIKENQPKGDTF